MRITGRTASIFVVMQGPLLEWFVPTQMLSRAGTKETTGKSPVILMMTRSFSSWRKLVHRSKACDSSKLEMHQCPQYEGVLQGESQWYSEGWIVAQTARNRTLLYGSDSIKRQQALKKLWYDEMTNAWAINERIATVNRKMCLSSRQKI